MKILHIEDEAIIAIAVKMEFKKIGYTDYAHVSNPEKALKYLSENKVDIILLDVGLNGNVNGIELAKMINENHSIPIIFVSGYDLKEIEKIPNALCFMPKPLNFTKIKEILDNVFNK